MAAMDAVHMMAKNAMLHFIGQKWHGLSMVDRINTFCEKKRKNTEKRMQNERHNLHCLY